AAERHAEANAGRHRAVHQPVPAPPIPSWLPRIALAGVVAAALTVGVLATTSAAGSPTRHAAHPGAAADAAAAGIARLSLGAPHGAKLLPAHPVHVSRPAAATPVAISGLAADGIPAVALNAYRLAAARLASAQPGCGLQWWLLAGIGRIESDHGRYGGSTLSASGESSPHIIGPALDGTGYAYIADTDGGRLDADPRVDHAVGPMQFIPSTWAGYGIDGNGDRVASPFNIYDAALAAARYLCAAGGDLRTPAGQRRAVLAYNHSDEYLALVLGTAAAYASGTSLDAPIRGVSTGTLPPVDTSWLPPVNPGGPAGAGSGTLPQHSGARSPAAGPSSTSSGSSGSSASGSNPAGSGSSGSGSSGSNSSGTGSSAPASPPPATSPAPAHPTPSSSQPAPSGLPLPGLPLPTLSNPVAQPSPTGSTACTATVLGIVVEVPCTGS
ncbi:MAG TPA: lytic transglycosylase domain-containing protein, partial [Jatrophihabitans sp.]|nr:lytic transglycosylase domain-containing protein [Jatrophihabitans sp.]